MDMKEAHPKGPAARVLVFSRASFGWAIRSLVVVGRAQLVDQPGGLVEVLLGESGGDGDELGHRVAANAERVDVAVADAGQVHEVRLLNQGGKPRVEHDTLRHDARRLASGSLGEDIGGNGGDFGVVDGEHGSPSRSSRGLTF
jgi:hypothetical protein